MVAAQHSNEPCIIALGFFDGVHLGHQQIIKVAKKIAQDQNLIVAVMTFFPHPSKVIKPDEGIDQFLTPLPIKQEIFRDLDVEKMLIVEFDKDFANLPHKEFIDQYICGLNCQHVVAGFDFSYGYRGLGNMSTLVADAQGRFGVTTVEKLECNDQKISSTHIRKLLEEGFVEKIPDFLGENYKTEGVVDSYPFQNVVKVLVEMAYRLPCRGFYRIKAILWDIEKEGICYVTGQSNFQKQSLLVWFDDSINFINEEEDMTIKWIERLESNEQMEVLFMEARQVRAI